MGLEVTNQTSLAVEKYARNGVHKNVHVVVKNTPFHIHVSLGSRDARELDFNRLTLEASLFYDEETHPKEVDFVKAKPLEYKVQVNEQADQCTVEARIKVLTSQLEDMFFRIHFRAVDTMTKQRYDGVCRSEPIKVISKPDQLKKKAPKSKKRSLTDILVDTLNRIEQQQAAHQQLLHKLYEKSEKTESQTSLLLDSHHPASPPTHGGTGLGGAQPIILRASASGLPPTPYTLEPSTTPVLPSNALLSSPSPLGSEDFESAFTTFLQCYHHLQPDEKPTKIRKVVRSISQRDSDKLTELLDMFWTDGLQKEPRRDFAIGVVDCSEECPHKKQLEQIDGFYKDFLTFTHS